LSQVSNEEKAKRL